MDEIPKNTAWRWGEDDWKKIDPISDEKIKELDHWYDQCQSNSVMMHFCDRDYWEMRARMRQEQKQITSLQARMLRLREAARKYAYLYGPRVGQYPDELWEAIKEAEG